MAIMEVEAVCIIKSTKKSLQQESKADCRVSGINVFTIWKRS
jgi:hypothetical protein